MKYPKSKLFINPISAGTVFICHNMSGPSIYRYILTYKDSPRTERIKIFVIATLDIGIQMKQKELRHL